MSKQLKWFCNFLAIFRRKTPEELSLDGDKFGTHRMTVTESRNQGADAMGHKDVVKNLEGKYEQMYINYEIKDFNVEEKGTLEDIISAKSEEIEVEEEEDMPQGTSKKSEAYF